MLLSISNKSTLSPGPGSLCTGPVPSVSSVPAYSSALVTILQACVLYPRPNSYSRRRSRCAILGRDRYQSVNGGSDHMSPIKRRGLLRIGLFTPLLFLLSACRTGIGRLLGSTPTPEKLPPFGSRMTLPGTLDDY